MKIGNARDGPSAGSTVTRHMRPATCTSAARAKRLSSTSAAGRPARNTTVSPSCTDDARPWPDLAPDGGEDVGGLVRDGR